MFFTAQTITAIVLVTLIGAYLLNLVADYLNIGNLSPTLPQAFKDVYDQERYEKSQAYLKADTRFGLVVSTVDLALLLAFWFLGGFSALDAYTRSLAMGPVVSGLVFIGILSGLKFIISLPFSIYSTFVIEERFGFNKTTVRLFIIDTIKSILLSVVLGGALLSVILWFFQIAGTWAWAICWAVTCIFMLAVQYIVPTWIMPLFNKFTPISEGELKKTIFSYAESIDFPLTQIFVMDGSKRSSKSNAFFTGFGKNKRIVLYDTLIKEQSTEELLAVLAHEMGHYKKKHIQRRLGLGLAQMGIIFYLLSLFLTQQGIFNAFFVDTPSTHAGLIFFSILFSPIDLIISIVMQASSRKDEYQADRFSARTTQKPDALISALKKLSAHNLSNLTPHPFFVFLNYSHPPIMERIDALHQIKTA